jgi:hypothetical protein
MPRLRNSPAHGSSSKLSKRRTGATEGAARDIDTPAELATAYHTGRGGFEFLRRKALRFQTLTNGGNFGAQWSRPALLRGERVWPDGPTDRRTRAFGAK